MKKPGTIVGTPAVELIVVEGAGVRRYTNGMGIDSEYNFYKKNLEHWLEEHKDEYVVVQAEEFWFFPSIDEALDFVNGRFEPGDFLLQQVIPEADDTMVYYSPSPIFL